MFLAATIAALFTSAATVIAGAAPSAAAIIIGTDTPSTTVRLFFGTSIRLLYQFHLFGFFWIVRGHDFVSFLSEDVETSN